MPRRKRNARKQHNPKHFRRLARLCWIEDDGIRPGRVVAAAEYIGEKVDAC